MSDVDRNKRFVAKHLPSCLLVCRVLAIGQAQVQKLVMC
jgi:hypothetical protein